jgi:hypothetical protein
MSSSSEAKNLEAIVKAIEHHDRTCEYPSVAVCMNPFELDRLGWDTIKGLPIRSDPELGTGEFTVVCAGEGSESEDTVEATAEDAVPAEVVPVGVPAEDIPFR